MDSHTYSLWLTPADNVHEALAHLIADLAEQHHGPRFPPHITVLGSVVGPEDEIVQRAEQIAELTPALTIELDGLGAEDVYFRSLYLVAKPAPALMAANDRARQVFDSQEAEPFRPHLSLLYGDYPTQTKQAIAEAIQPRLPAAFQVRTLDLYQTEPPVTAWRLVRRFVLTTGG